VAGPEEELQDEYVHISDRATRDAINSLIIDWF
jgi:hypothetical protein